jgi:hypothetical protein
MISATDWASPMLCMLCGERGEMRESEPDTYREYGSDPDEHTVVWVYCKPCDCWTQHGKKN